jgi:serine protease Do
VALYLGKPGLHAVLVSDVLPNSPAERAGLKSGDLLTRVGDTPVEAETEQDVPRFAQLITHLAPGTKFQATYLRDGQSHQVEVTVGLQPLMEGKELETNFGTVLHEITMNQVLQYRLERTHGVLVTEVRSGSPGDDAGLERGDVILAVDGHPVESMAQLTAAIDKPVREKFLLQVMKGKLRFFAFVDRSPRLRDRKTSESATPSTP